MAAVGLAVAAILMSMASAPGFKAVADQQTVAAGLAYACQFPSGDQQIKVQVKAAFPRTAQVGKPIQPDAATVTASVPQAALADVRKLGATSVTASADLAVLVRQSDLSADTRWTALTAPAASVPPSGNLTSAMSGPVPPVTVPASGSTDFSAGRLSLTLVLHKPDGTATTPDRLSVDCTPDLGQNTIMLTLLVSGPQRRNQPQTSPPVVPPVAPRAATPGTGDICPPLPPGGYNPAFPPPPNRPTDGPDLVHTQFPQIGCVAINGYSDVKKLDAASSVNGVAAIDLGSDLYNSTVLNYFEADNFGKAYISVTRGTFLAFGFMPTEAKLEITQVKGENPLSNGNLNAFAVGPELVGLPGARPTITDVYSYVSIRVFDVKVNGVPLDVGNNCHTATAVLLHASGSTQGDPPYQAAHGGLTSGVVKIPAFTGCGAHENLDSLFTSSVSGAGNYLGLLQGPICIAEAPDDPGNPCPVDKRTGKRGPGAYGFTISPGGRFSGTAAPGGFGLVTSNIVRASCTSSSLGGTLRTGTGLFPKMLGTITDFRATDCKGPQSVLKGPVNITPIGLPWTLRAVGVERPYDGRVNGGTTMGVIDGMGLHIAGQLPPLCSFDAVQPGDLSAAFQFENDSQVLRFGIVGGSGTQRFYQPLQLTATNVSRGCGRRVRPGAIVQIPSNTQFASVPYKLSGPNVQRITAP